MPRRSLTRLYKDEFSNYSLATFQKDLIAGLSVAAVALPLALAFGVGSGAGAAAGLITSIVGGLLIGALGGAPYQISGAKAVTSVVLIVLVNRYGLEGMWFATLFSGLLMFAIGLMRLGRFTAFVPAPVIRGFTLGIALIIIIRQTDNLLGIKTPTTETAAQKLIGYFNGGFTPNLQAILIGLVVIGIMILWPKKWNAYFPSSLLGLIAAALLNWTLGWSATTIGFIPRTLILEKHLSLTNIPWTHLTDFIAPALTLTALGSIEAFLCGAAGSNMTGVRLQVNQQLIGQGLGNIALPFFGAIPTTSAMIRTKVAIQSGGQTRMVSIIHSIILLLAMFLFAPFIEKIPLAALAGVLMVTAYRTIEWDAIKRKFGKRFKSNMIAFTISVIATVVFNLTDAILAGTLIVGAFFLNKIASIDIEVQDVDIKRLKERGIRTAGKCKHVQVAFMTGPLFFAATGKFNEAFTNLNDTHALILSMRGVPLIDTEGLEELYRLYEKLRKQGGTLMFAGVHENARVMMERDDLVETIGEENFFWSSDQAIVEAERRGCPFCESDRAS
ncbi:MAG: SulP family inorganic anion transporter [Chloroflexi bacterium]|nr:SulP family inorganic anion transporter [Chloroflexota bacterium]